MRRAPALLLILLPAVLGLAGCGAAHPKPLTGVAALEAKIRDLPRDTRRLTVSCVSRACTLTWNERVHDSHEGWLIARTTIGEMEDPDFFRMRHYRLRIRDLHTQRLWLFSCRRPRNPDRTDANWPYDLCAQSVRPLT
jgi:hypothetical protein